MLPLEYIAGLIDGEGCITIHTRNDRAVSVEHYPVVCLTLGKAKNIVTELKERFGGSVRVAYKFHKNGKTSIVDVWKISSRKAYAFLKQILPYLQIKRRQAELVIEFYDGFKAGYRYGASLDEIKRRERIRRLIHKLNGGKSGFKPWNPNGTIWSFDD